MHPAGVQAAAMANVPALETREGPAPRFTRRVAGLASVTQSNIMGVRQCAVARDNPTAPSGWSSDRGA